MEEATFEPRAGVRNKFIFRNVNRYLTSGITRQDIKSVFAGLRPLVKAPGQKNTALMPRDHTIIVSKSKLVTITGGKWTTYRKMAKDAIDNASFTAKLPRKPCITETLKLHGWTSQTNEQDPLHYYGADEAPVKKN